MIEKTTRSKWSRRIAATAGIAAALATTVALGLAIAPDSAEARPGSPGSGNKYCYVIYHYQGNGTYEVIITDDRALWQGHYKHGDYTYQQLGYCNNS